MQSSIRHLIRGKLSYIPLVFAKGTTLDSQARGNILKALRQTASDNVKNKSPCLEPCLRQLESMLAELPQHSPGKKDLTLRKKTIGPIGL